MRRRFLATLMLVFPLCSSVSFAELRALTDNEMKQVEGRIISPALNERQAIVLMELIANNRNTTELLTDKINERLQIMHLELVAEETIRREIQRMNSVAMSDARLAQSLDMLNRMFINRRLYEEAQLRDAQRRAIMQGFINAVMHSNFKNNPSYAGAVLLLEHLNPYSILAKYPNLLPGPNGEVISKYGPNSPSLDIHFSR
ncbi:hypothetical protein QJS83_08685 [Bdellovibrio sp. 22V]|uniref:hypothetical protein n=1 Tax=Bdellovibrio TaxID=958 RepID=UPI002543BB53|nr:hypothetical protein [Bdellovibrio sp. 22V]WII70532.1 hypothetical protein QJS83_08685 [Bdellovibrio sp. 22V]